MAVTKRVRFEVLRRDNYTCRYCHATDKKLTIDHVIPQALGGSDNPNNLVACCMDCNSGKTSINPDEPLVADVSAQALSFRRILEHAKGLVSISIENEQDYLDYVFECWQECTEIDDEHYIALPDSWMGSARYWYSIDVPMDYLRYAFTIAKEKADAKRIPRRNAFAYASGIIGNKMHEAMDLASKEMSGQ